MTKIEQNEEKVVIINKNGCRTLMPNLWMAKSYANGMWKGSVDKIEVTTTYIVEEE